MPNYGITEDGKLALECICEDGKTELDGSILGDGRIVPIYMLFSEEVGTGQELLGSRSLGSQDTGAGADAISESLLTRLESDTGAGVDALISLLKLTAKFGSDTGSGVDAVSELLAALTQSDQGAGIDAIKARLLRSSDVGVGADAWSGLLAAIQDSDVGVGADAWSGLLAAIQDSDVGVGAEAHERVVWLYLLLKLLQKKGLNIGLSQKGKDVNLKLSQEDKSVNLKLSQEGNPK